MSNVIPLMIVAEYDGVVFNECRHSSFRYHCAQLPHNFLGTGAVLLRILLKLNVISSWPQSDAIRKRCSNLAKCITGNGRSKNLVPIGTNRCCLDKQNGRGSRKAADTGGISQLCICKKRDPYPFCLGTDRKIKTELRTWAASRMWQEV